MADVSTVVQVPSLQAPVASRPAKPAGSAAATVKFDAVLNDLLDGRDITFSRHALTRLKSRGISLSSNDLDKIEKAAGTAQQKGSKDSLILMRNLGLIMNIKNRTVLTAIDSSDMKEKIFTNIDSTVIVPSE